MIDYHVHTLLCNHATGVMDAYVRAAVDRGLRTICFLDHLTLWPEGAHLSMHPNEVALYFRAVSRIRDRHRDRIQVRAGLEIDYHPQYMDEALSIARRFAFDVIAVSVHYPAGIDVVTDQGLWARGEMTANVAELYLDALEDVLDFEGFDMLCHIDLIKKFGQRPDLFRAQRMEAVLEKICDKRLAVEVNTSGCRHLIREPYPGLELLKLCRRMGIAVTLGSDAHMPEQVGFGHETAFSLLHSAGYRQITEFCGQEPYPVDIL